MFYREIVFVKYYKKLFRNNSFRKFPNSLGLSLTACAFHVVLACQINQ